MDILTRRLRDLATHIKTIFDGLNSRLTKIEGVGADATRTALSGKQPLDATLTALSGANWVSGTQLLSLTAADTITLKTVGAAAGNILDKAAGDGLYQPIGTYLTANQAITLSGDASGSGTTAITVTIGANKVTRAMLAQATGATILGATGAGNVSDLTAAQAKTFLAIVAADVGGLGYFATGTDAANLTGTVAAGRLPAFAGGDVTSSAGSVVLTIGANKVTRSMMAATAGATILGSTGAGNVADLTAAQVKTFLAIANTDVSGLGTASTASTGTSGHTVPFLDGANTFSAAVSGTSFTGSGAGTFAGVKSSNDNWLRADGQLQLSSSSGVLLLYAHGSGNFAFENSNETVQNVTIDNSGNLAAVGSILSKHVTAGIGYATGAGGTISQATSKSTGVTLNKVCGQITMNAAALASVTGVSFTVTNSAVAATDTIDLVLQSGNTTAGTYNYQVDKVSAGSFVIWVKNISAGSLSEALVFNFSVKKAVTS